MKANQLVLLFLFLLLGVAAAQQTNSLLGVTNSSDAFAFFPQAQQTNSSLGATNNAVVEELKTKAEKGDAAAEYVLGYWYANGQGVATNYVEAVKWYRKATEQNLAWAQFDLGRCYDNGQGVATNYVEAVKWYRKAAEQNDALGQCFLGHSYYYGQGVATNYVEAVKWYRKAAEQNDDGAQFHLGYCYYYGQGVVKDEVVAAKWWRKAAEQNYAPAQFNLGCCYANGQGVPKDYAEAFNWAYKAADQGNVDAQCQVGFSYLVGFGTPKDNIEAYKWYNLAAARGNQLAKTHLEALEQQMTPEQIAEAQRLTREYKPGASAKTADSLSKEAQQEPQLNGNGTGFFITEDGYLISNYHVVKDATKVRLLTSAGLIDAKVVSVDAANDLALLKADGRFARLPISPSRTAHLGSTVATVGFPNIGLQGFAPKFARGEIASLSGAADDPRYFQISVPVQPGNSGGALVDDRGNVIGIVSAKLDASVALAASGALPENVNYAVKSSFLLSFLESVPAISAKLKAPITADRKFEDVVKSAQDAAVLVLVY